MSGKSYVYIKRPDHSEESFGTLPITMDDNIVDITERACEKFKNWQADASRVKLFLVSKERAKEILKGATFDHTAQTALSSLDTLAEANVTSLSCLLALVAPPPPIPGKCQLLARTPMSSPCLLFFVLLLIYFPSCLAWQLLVSNGLACLRCVLSCFPSRACAGDRRASKRQKE
jgi:hypothetical protein